MEPMASAGSPLAFAPFSHRNRVNFRYFRKGPVTAVYSQGLLDILFKMRDLVLTLHHITSHSFFGTMPPKGITRKGKAPALWYGWIKQG